MKRALKSVHPKKDSSLRFVKANCVGRFISKEERQGAFKKEVVILHLSPKEAAERARLIPAADVKDFRVIRMLG